MIKELTSELGLTLEQQERLVLWVENNVASKTAGFLLTAEEIDESLIKDTNFLVELKRLKAGQEAAPLHKIQLLETIARPDGKQDIKVQFKIQALK